MRRGFDLLTHVGAGALTFSSSFDFDFDFDFILVSLLFSMQVLDDGYDYE